MRRFPLSLATLTAALLFLSLGFNLQEKEQGTASADSRTQAQTELKISFYAPDPNHIWNRLFRLFYVRTALNGRQYGGNELDPYLWQQTKYLLTGRSHAEARKLLNEFLDQHAERLITDPLHRAILQRDLWAVYDWLGNPYTEHQQAREQLRKQLAEIIRRLALTEDQIRALPDNYAAAIQAKAFADAYDSSSPEKSFLPNLFNPDGPWVCLGERHGRVLAISHTEFFGGRSTFLVFLRLPGGRAGTLAYLEKLGDIPSVWAAVGAHPEWSVRRRDPEPPQFPVGTQVALVRQAILISDQGKFVLTHLTESVELRVYRAIFGHPELEAAHPSQGVFEFKLNRAVLLRNASAGMEPAGEELPTFSTQGMDVFEEGTNSHDIYKGTMATRHCIRCHQNPGVHSFTSYSREQAPVPLYYGDEPPRLVESTPARETDLASRWRPQHTELNTYLLDRER